MTGQCYILKKVNKIHGTMFLYQTIQKFDGTFTSDQTKTHRQPSLMNGIETISFVRLSENCGKTNL